MFVSVIAALQHYLCCMRRTDPFERFPFTLSNRSVSKMLSETFFWMFIWWVFWSGLAILNSWLYFHTSVHIWTYSHKHLYMKSLILIFLSFFLFSSYGFYGYPFYRQSWVFFSLNNLNDCVSVCGGATVREAAVATSEASLLSSFCGTHASSMSLMCFFFIFVFFFCFKADILTPTLWLKSTALVQ